MVSIASIQQTILPSKPKTLPTCHPGTGMQRPSLILRIASTDHAVKRRRYRPVLLHLGRLKRNRLSLYLIISTQPPKLSHHPSPDSGAVFCAVSTTSHTACAVRSFGFENNKNFKGKITRENLKASSTTSCEATGRKCKARKEICARRIAREACFGMILELPPRKLPA